MMLTMRTIFTWIICFFALSPAFAYATQCSAIFPGSNSLASPAGAVIGSSVTCDGGNCQPIPNFEQVIPLPTISPTTLFNNNNLSDGVYEHTGWGMSSGQNVNFNGSGTAVIYFSGSVDIASNTKINDNGSPSDVLIVVYGSLTVRQGADINAHIYVAGATTIEQNTEFNGALSSAGPIVVGNNVDFTFDSADVDGLNGHGFCDSGPELLLHLPLDEGTGQTTADLSSYNRLVILGNSNSIDSRDPTWLCEASGHFMNFNRSSNQHLEVDAFTPPSQGTVAFWMRASSLTNARQRIFGFGNGWEARWERGDRRIYWDVNRPGSNGTIRTSSAVTELNQWIHFAFTTDATTGDWAVYKNGVLENSGNTSLTAQSASTLFIGGSSWRTTSDHFSGDLEDFRLYQGILSASEISALASNTPTEIPCEVTPIVNYRFDECSYTGISGDVLDQTNNFSGTSNGLTSPSVDAVLNSALDLSADGTSDWVQVPSNAIDGLDALSLSVWFKTDENKSQQEIFQALGSSTGDDEFEVYLQGDDDVIVKTKDDSTTLSSSIDFDDNRWYHMVITRSGEDVCLYINSALQDCDDDQNTGPLSVPNANAVVIGQEQDAFGGNFSTSQNFEGLLDEFKLFDVALSSNDVQTIYNNELAGNNFDGSTRDPVDCVVEAIAFYQFEQDNFLSGIEDSTSNAFTATNLGGALDNDSQYCRGFESNGDNNSDTTSNAFITPIDVDADIGVRGTISFWFNSDIDWNDEQERVLFDASMCANPNNCRASDKYFTLEIRSDGRLKFNFEDANDRDFSLTEPSISARDADTWYYITTTWDFQSNNFQLYVDGVQRFSRSVNNLNNRIEDLGNLVFGDNSSGYTGNGNSSLASPLSSHGRFDEVKIYNTVISQSQIEADMQGTDCDSNPLFQFTHDGNGITCQSEPVNVVACSNATCTSTDTSVNTSIDLVVSNGDSITVDIVNGVGVTAFNYTDTSTPAILSSSADYLCTNTSLSNSLGQTDADCGLNFSDAGFVFSTIGNQIAGVGYDGITITAIEANETGACSALFTSPTQVGLAMRYLAPNTTTSNTYTIGGMSINKSTVAPTTFTDIDLNFNASGVATLPQNIYYDAGQISLSAYKVIPASGNQVEVDLAGSSNSFWVRPDSFILTSPLAGASGIHAAGDDFNYEINAVNRQGTTTSNYRPSSSVQASVVRVTPTSNDATNGTFTFDDSLGGQVVTNGESFSNVNFDFQDIGIATFSTGAYSEVGSVSLDVRDNNYAGLGLVVDADAIVLGRFTPKYFEQTVIEHGEITGQCGTWAYSGQLTGVGGNGAISYSVAPTLSIVAKNADGETTLNYRNFGSGDNHSFLSSGNVVVSPPIEDIALGAESTPLLLSGTLFGGMLTQKLDEFNAIVSGEFSYTFSLNDHYVYTRDLNAVVTPFNAQFDIAVDSIADSDGVIATILNNVEIRGNTQIRFGRLLLENSYGPETSALAQVFKAQYLTNAATMSFTNNTDDSCSPISADNANWTITNNDTSEGLTANDIGRDGSDGTILIGEFDGISLRSTNNEQGSVNVEYSTLDWLKFDWNGDGVYDNDANAVVTFGRYRGNDRIIYWREVNN